jgi:hypothetical protein
MGPNQDPAPPFDAEAPVPAQPSEDLEHWLKDLRTEATADPFGWTGDAGDDPVDGETPGRTGPDEARGGGGRHRAPD